MKNSEYSSMFKLEPLKITETAKIRVEPLPEKTGTISVD